MTPEKNVIEKPKKGVTVDECIKKADKFIKSKGICLFLFDVKDSRKYSNREELRNQLLSLRTELNSEFGDYFPENDLAVKYRMEKGFTYFYGDGSWVGINNSEAIIKITNYINQKMPSTKLYFDVARDGYDSPNIEIIK